MFRKCGYNQEPMFQYNNYNGWEGLYGDATEKSSLISGTRQLPENLLCCPELDQVTRLSNRPDTILDIRYGQKTNYLRQNFELINKISRQ